MEDNLIVPGTASPFDETLYPYAKNKDGSYSSVKTEINERDGVYYIEPTIGDTSKHFGGYKDLDSALAAEEEFHKSMRTKAWAKSTVDEELVEIEKRKQEDQKKKVVQINIPHPVDIHNLVPRSLSQEDRNLWDLIILGPQVSINGERPKSREEIYQEEVEQNTRDFDAGTAEAIIRGAKPEAIARSRALRLAFEKYNEKNSAGGSENSYEWEAASKKALNDIMTQPELYQYAKTGDIETDYTNALFYDELFSRAIWNKAKDVSLLEEIGAQFFGEGSAMFAGSSAASWMPVAGAKFGPIGAAVGVAGMLGAGWETMYQYRKARIGMGTSSVNTAGKKLREEYLNLKKEYPNKIDFNREVNNLVNRYFTNDNREYWGDLATIAIGGEKPFLDMGPLTSSLIEGGFKGTRKLLKSGWSILRPKTKTEAIKQAVSDSKELSTWKAENAEGSNKVYEGEIVSGKLVKTEAGVNEGMSKEGIDIDAESWTITDPEGKTTVVFRDPKTGNIIRWGSYKSITNENKGTVQLMTIQDMKDSVSPSRGVKDFDSVINDGTMIYLGTGADYIQPYASYKAASEAISNWSSKLQTNQVPTVIEEAPGQYYIGVATMPESYFNLGIESVEDIGEGGKVFWHERKFDTYEDALEYRNDLREMELEEQGLTPVSAGSANRFKEFKNKEKSGWDRDHPAYFAPGNYLSVENIGNPNTTKKVNLGEISEIRPESRYSYFQTTVQNSLMDLVDTKEFDKYVEKTLKGINHSHFKYDKEGAISSLDWIWSEKGPDGFIEYLKSSTEDLNDAWIKERYREIPKENADEEIYEMLVYKYVLDNIDKVKTNLMSSSVNTPNIVQISSEAYIKISDEARRYLMNLTGSKKEISDYVYYDIKDRMLSPIGEQDAEAMRTTDVMRSIIDKLIFKNPIKYTGDTLQELEKKISENRFGADIKINYKELEKDLTKAYKKLLKENDLEVLGHEKGSNIVVSNPKKINKVSKIETITAKGKYIQEIVDNDYIIRYNKETGDYQIGEVRGGQYKLKQDVKDMGIW